MATIGQAQRLLKELGFDKARTNERSAMILLALLNLRKRDRWNAATNPALRNVEIMNWVNGNFGKDYKPNTRETFRKETLDQFVDDGLVLRNTDKPDRPPNSPSTNYHVDPHALEVIRAFESDDYEYRLKEYLALKPTLREKYAAARDMNKIPVTLPSGAKRHLSSGGQNELLKSILDEFCPRFARGGQVLYVGDARKKWESSDAEALKALGVTLNDHGKMPDLIVHHVDRNWLILIEAVVSGGHLDAKRKAELKALFGGASAGLVFVTCFPSRESMRRFLPDIAWESEVWCADHPSHLIHFNGERFLGPYSEDDLNT